MRREREKGHRERERASKSPPALSKKVRVGEKIKQKSTRREESSSAPQNPVAVWIARCHVTVTSSELAAKFRSNFLYSFFWKREGCAFLFFFLDLDLNLDAQHFNLNPRFSLPFPPAPALFSFPSLRLTDEFI